MRMIERLRLASVWSRSIRVRLTLWYLVIVLLVLSLFAALVYVGLSRSLRAEIDHALGLAAQRSLAFSASGQPQLLPRALPADYIIGLYALDGSVLDAGRQREWLPLAPRAIDAALQGRPVLLTLEHVGETWRVLAQPVAVGGRAIAILQVARSEESMEEALEQLSELLLVLVPTTLLLAGAGGLFLAKRALDPIDRITRTAAGIGAGDLSQRLPEGATASPDEVGRLAATFNGMLHRLESAFLRQRQFTADASHELRTPVTLMLSQLDVVLERARSPEEYERALRSLRDDTWRLRRLLEDLLTLARADAQQDVLQRERLDLGELAEQVVESMQPLATERNVRLTVRAERDICVFADQARLMQLVLNLVENGVRHTLGGGLVAVSVERTPKSLAALTVRDTGIGIPPEHLPHVFERFYRVDPARSSGGTGLGLAISRQIAEAHSGAIEVQSEVGEGTTFCVLLPLAMEEAP